MNNNSEISYNPTDNTQSQQKEPKNKTDFFWDVIKFAALAILIVVPIRTFIAQPFVVSGHSMKPTFEHGEYLIIDQVSYHFSEPNRGDVVIFRYPKNPDKFFIKRIIGLPGESLSTEDNKILIEKDGQSSKLQESKIDNNQLNNINISLDEEEYFVMGDNRRASSDSRAWGALSEDMIIGKAFLRLFPVSSVSIYPGKMDMISKPITQ